MKVSLRESRVTRHARPSGLRPQLMLLGAALAILTAATARSEATGDSLSIGTTTLMILGEASVSRPAGMWEQNYLANSEHSAIGYTLLRKDPARLEGVLIKWIRVAPHRRVAELTLAEVMDMLLLDLGHFRLTPGLRPISTKLLGRDEVGDADRVRYRVTGAELNESDTWTYRLTGSLTIPRSRPGEALQLEHVVWRKGTIADWADSTRVPEDLVAEALLGSARLSGASPGVVLSDSLAPDLECVVGGRNGLWVSSPTSGEVLRLDPTSLVTLQRLHPGGEPRTLLEADGRLWVADIARGRVLCYDEANGSLLGEVKSGPQPLRLFRAGSDVLVLDGSSKEVLRIDAATRKRGPKFKLPCQSFVGAMDGDALWVGGGEEKRLFRTSTTDGKVLATIPVDGVPTGLTVGAGSLWVSCIAPSVVDRLDSATGEVHARVVGGPFPWRSELRGEDLWVADFLEGSVRLIKAGSTVMAEPVRLGHSTSDILISEARMYAVDRVRGRVATFSIASTAGQ